MKTAHNRSILRVIAAIAIVLFSFEITASLFVSDDVQIEIVDIDIDDDTEMDDQNDSVDLIHAVPSADWMEISSTIMFSVLSRLDDLHLKELPHPPPERV